MAATYSLNVSRIEPLSPHQKRIVLNGAALAAFPEDFDGGYIKVLFASTDGDVAAEEAKPPECVRRSFTVRRFDAAHQELTLDVAEHQALGPGMRWAKTVAVGDRVRVAGPGPVKRLDPTAGWFLAAGDLSALPAIEVNLERLPSSAVGHVFVEIPEDSARRPLVAPHGVAIHWIENARPNVDESPLLDAVRALDWRSGRVSAWVACEFAAMRRFRSYLRDERQLTREDFYLSSYWKLGATDEEHKAAKQADK
ncbi:MAG: siderophore-interacting protein [Myxococcota bacterium]